MQSSRVRLRMDIYARSYGCCTCDVQEKYRTSGIFYENYRYLLGMWCVVCMFRKSTVRPVFFMKSTVCSVFVGYVVSSVYVQEKYRTSGIFYEKYRMSGICWVCGV